DLVSTTWTRFKERMEAEKLPFPDDPAFLEDLFQVWVASQFAADYCVRNPSSLLDLKNSGRLSTLDRSDSYRDELLRFGFDSEEELMRGLRDFRNREMIRIAWRDIMGLAALNQTLVDLSLLAEACLESALDHLYAAACARFGTPTRKNGGAQGLVVLGMGKLGARELNFSSDIDLIFAFEEEGLLPGKKEKSHGEFFTELCKSLIRVIDTVTAEGFVFRVDLRLRPFGDSGPLVMSFSAMENYYQRQAREWERYALIKARPVAGDLAAGSRLETMLKPFVYRRYLDYGSFAELRNLKSKITLELQRKDRMENIKLGPGGIREIEFIGQAFQLVRGGHDRSLQERRIQKALKVIGSKSLLPEPVVEKLLRAYEFLRKVENRLQELADRQVHDLPLLEFDRQRIAYALGFEDWNQAKRKIDRVRAEVHQVFEQVFVSPQSDGGEGDAEIVWMRTANTEQLTQALQRIGYRQSAEALEIVDGFRRALAIRKLSAAGASTLDRLMPLLLAAVGRTAAPEDVLKKILRLVESIASRKAYLSLLVENPLALSQLVKLAAASSWIVGFIGRHPILLDELLDPRTLYAPLSRQALINEIDLRLAGISSDDLERQMAELREFKQARGLRVAAADIAGVIPVSIVSDCLTDIAEVVLEKVLNLAWRLVAEKHGTPPGADRENISGFAIIGYGKLGGRELGYGSDLDLVFLHAEAGAEEQTNGGRPISCLQFYVRVGQRVVNLLDTKMLSGVLYEVDMRLRPSGRAGFLVSQIEAFEQYQLKQAWTWEHQALVRARFVAGDVLLGKRFHDVRAKVLARKRNRSGLKKEVREMRDKMRENLATLEPGLFDLKQGIGGIADIEFIVQFGVLLNAYKNRNLLKFSDTVHLLDILSESGFLRLEDAEFLKRAYFEFRNLGHRAALQERPAVIPENKLIDFRARVEQTWLRLTE
ncbi:MAG: bifunctional [glutamate--ammonia ligase]-adenylyl-L-tyrosine phosphorylase/[glutamate--ammonia-ligase] adenylyltransferase, partial [Methylococcaceae bacterium]|nr:bifunctional [glutamate--ammonia ligase]-adenylyl-L-tyrosine phosphorylase/[glutamate--ammonia-ligase] adenylyltransferase [Methylococcaceae bacterium]